MHSSLRARQALVSLFVVRDFRNRGLQRIGFPPVSLRRRCAAEHEINNGRGQSVAKSEVGARTCEGAFGGSAGLRLAAAGGGASHGTLRQAPAAEAAGRDGTGPRSVRRHASALVPLFVQLIVLASSCMSSLHAETSPPQRCICAHCSGQSSNAEIGPSMRSGFAERGDSHSELRGVLMFAQFPTAGRTCCASKEQLALPTS